METEKFSEFLQQSGLSIEEVRKCLRKIDLKKKIDLSIVKTEVIVLSDDDDDDAYDTKTEEDYVEYMVSEENDVAEIFPALPNENSHNYNGEMLNKIIVNEFPKTDQNEEKNTKISNNTKNILKLNCDQLVPYDDQSNRNCDTFNNCTEIVSLNTDSVQNDKSHEMNAAITGEKFYSVCTLDNNAYFSTMTEQNEDDNKQDNLSAIKIIDCRTLNENEYSFNEEHVTKREGISLKKYNPIIQAKLNVTKKYRNYRRKRNSKKFLDSKLHISKSLNSKPIDFECDTDSNSIRDKIKTQLGLLRAKRQTPMPILLKRPSCSYTALTENTSNHLNNQLKLTVHNGKEETKTQNIEPNEFDCIEINPKENVDDVLNVIKPTKTKDVTKIKGWKKKVFLVNKENSSNKTENTVISKSSEDNSSSKILNSKTSNINGSLEENSFGYFHKLEIGKPEEVSPAEDQVPKIIKSFETTLNLPSTSLAKPDKNSNSAFISKNLDDFLSNDSFLKISYEVPYEDHDTNEHSTFEESQESSLTTGISPLNYHPQQNVQNPSNNSEKKGYKPKTLAEKRRMLELANNLVQREDKQYLPNYPAPTRGKNLNKENKQDSSNHKISTERKRRRRKNREILRSDKPSLSKEKGVYKRKIPLKNISQNQQTQKPSMLQDLKMLQKQKPSLEQDERYQAVEVQLPKISLEITPEIGKPIDAQIEYLLHHDGSCLDFKRTEFALSVLKNKNSTNEPQTFSFPILYENGQKTMKLYKKRLFEAEDDATIAEAVRRVMDKLLEYTENFEETNLEYYNMDLDGEIEEQTPFEMKSSKKQNNKQNLKLGSTGGRKMALEMKRLNCKIVEVNIDDDATVESGICQKEYCKMGCVCKSLECNPLYLVKTHCKLAPCIFQCKCSPVKRRKLVKNVSLPNGTNLLESEVINHLENVAKKDLARVERDFTQTLISTKNQVILVENTGRRRATKIPRKYDDFLNDQKITSDQTNSSFENLDLAQQFNLKPCTVSLEHCDLKKTDSLCSIHQVQNCNCSDAPNKRMKTLEVTENSKVALKTLKYDQCSRTKQINSKYYLQRNKSRSHKSRISQLTKSLIAEQEQTKNNKPTLNEHSVVKIKNSKIINQQYTTCANSQYPIIRILKKPNILERRKSTNNNVSTERNVVSKTPETLHDELPKVPNSNQNTKLISMLDNPNSNLHILPWSKLLSNFNNGTFHVWYSSSLKSSSLLITEKFERPSPHHYSIKIFEFLKDNSFIPLNIILWLTAGKAPGNKKLQDFSFIFMPNQYYFEIYGVCEKICENNADAKSLSVRLLEPLQLNNCAFGKKPELLQKASKCILNSEYKWQTRPLKNVTFRYTKCNGSYLCFVNQLNFTVPFFKLPCKWRVVYMDRKFTHIIFKKNVCILTHKLVVNGIMQARDTGKTSFLRVDSSSEFDAIQDFGMYCDPNCFDKILIGPFKLHEKDEIETHDIDSPLSKTVEENIWFYQDNDTETTQSIDDNTVNTGNTIETSETTQSMVDTTVNTGNTVETSELIDLTNDDEVATSAISGINLYNLWFTKYYETKSMTNLENAKAFRNILAYKSWLSYKDKDKFLLKLSQQSKEEFEELKKEFKEDTAWKILDDILKNAVYKLPNESSNLSTINEYYKGLKNKSEIRYIFTNIQKLGHIKLIIHSNKEVDYKCPLTGAIKRCSSLDETLAQVGKLFKEYFIYVPEDFNLNIHVVDKIPRHNAEINRLLLSGCSAIGSFGLINTAKGTPDTLKMGLNFTSDEIRRILFLRDKVVIVHILRQLCEMLSVSYPSKEHSHGTTIIEILTKIINLSSTHSESSDIFKAQVNRTLSLLTYLPQGFQNRIQYQIVQIILSLIENSTNVSEIIDLDDDTPEPKTVLNTVTLLPAKSENSLTFPKLNSEIECSLVTSDLKKIKSKSQLTSAYVTFPGLANREIFVPNCNSNVNTNTSSVISPLKNVFLSPQKVVILPKKISIPNVSSPASTKSTTCRTITGKYFPKTTNKSIFSITSSKTTAVNSPKLVEKQKPVDNYVLVNKQHLLVGSHDIKSNGTTIK